MCPAADKLGHQLMCPCGCAEILVECNHVGCPDSSRMIAELHAKIDGSASAPPGGDPNTNTSILLWFSEKYGATVLAAPLRGGFDNVAWIAPFAVFFLATIGTAVTIRLWKLRGGNRPAPAVLPGNAAADALRERIRRETQY
jgi:cytochrome c-type biogenesis protein CcmH